MKNHLLPSLFLAASVSFAGVPSEINYQGRLTDANGDPVTGEVTMSLKMFDAATAGNELYSEEIGTVTLDDNGVYSFPFGADGQSVVATSESITSTDGVNQVFNATLANLPVDGSVSLSDGTYTWSQVNGSSSAADFTASVTPASGAVSAIYLSGAPAAGVEITATYDYLDASVVGALSSHESHWLELSVDGTAQSPRERVLSVPFAQVAGSVVVPLQTVEIQYNSNWRLHESYFTYEYASDYYGLYKLPKTTRSGGNIKGSYLIRNIEYSGFDVIVGMDALMRNGYESLNNTSVSICSIDRSGQIDVLCTLEASYTKEVYSLQNRITLDWSQYSYFVSAYLSDYRGGDSSMYGGQLDWLSLTYEK